MGNSGKLKGNVGVFIKGSSMAEIEGLVRALREGDDAAKTAAARALGRLACGNFYQNGLIAEAGGIAPLVQLLHVGSAGAKNEALSTLRPLAACGNNVPIAEAGGIPLLVELLRDGSARAKLDAAWVLGHLAYDNAANAVAIAAAGGVPPLVDLLRNGSANAEFPASLALRGLTRDRFGVHDNDANAVAIALTVGLEALVQLARSGDVTVDNTWIVRNAGLPAKRKAALVVSALLRDCVPGEKRSQVRDLIRAVIGPCL
ncbi:hypothetical protein SO694_00022213 [Aureococcus anophagefferens]|uniref:Vacuolar protein 8 n=1 Tax=Aureococcus anophagefferens TaxID=44056 RepID=A0ABR1FT49_AURAN|nr:hypothetical protein JL721_6549 [Aureococcus anophagefferens]